MWFFFVSYRDINVPILQIMHTWTLFGEIYPYSVLSPKEKIGYTVVKRVMHLAFYIAILFFGSPGVWTLLYMSHGGDLFQSGGKNLARKKLDAWRAKNFQNGINSRELKQDGKNFFVLLLFSFVQNPTLSGLKLISYSIQRTASHSVLGMKNRKKRRTCKIARKHIATCVFLLWWWNVYYFVPWCPKFF